MYWTGTDKKLRKLLVFHDLKSFLPTRSVALLLDNIQEFQDGTCQISLTLKIDLK